MKYRKLNEISTIIMGQSPNSDTYNAIGEGVPFFQGKADFGKINPTVRMYCSKPNKLAETSDILMSVRAPVGDVNIAREQCCIGRGLCAIRGKSYINNKFLYYYLITIKEELNSKATGSTFKAINKSILEELSIPNISLDKQNSIVEVLDKAQELIDKRKGQIEALDELVKSQFIEMFGDVKLNPFNWNCLRLEEVYEIIDGDRGKNYPKQEEFTEEGYCLFLNAGNVTINGFSFEKNAFISKERDEILRKGKLKRNDLIVTTRGTVGNIAYYNEFVPFDNIRINSGMVILRKRKDINPVFFIQYFKNPIVYQSLISGSAQPQMPITSMKNAKVFNPPIELQSQFADFVKKIDKLKFEMEKSLKELENNFNSLMQKAFNGELFN